MTRLESLLTHAAEDAPVSFDVADIRRRVARRRNRRRVIGGTTAALLLTISVGLVMVAYEPNERLDTAEGPIEEITLVGRWTPTAYSDVTTGAAGAFLEFGPDGWFTGFNGCNGFNGAWRLDDDQLKVSDIMINLNACPPSTVIAPITTLLDQRPTVSRFDSQPHTLQLTAPSGFIAFERSAEPSETSDSSTIGTLVPATWSSATEVEPGFLRLTVPCQYTAGEAMTGRVELHETDETVTVDLFVRVPGEGAPPCGDEVGHVDVMLIDPVGTRRVTQSTRPSPEQP